MKLKHWIYICLIMIILFSSYLLAKQEQVRVLNVGVDSACMLSFDVENLTQRTLSVGLLLNINSQAIDKSTLVADAIVKDSKSMTVSLKPKEKKHFKQNMTAVSFLKCIGLLPEVIVVSVK